MAEMASTTNGSGEEKVNVESQIRTDSRGYNAGTKSKQMVHEVINSAMNYHTIATAIETGRAINIAEYPKAPLMEKEKPPAFIIGSGASLDKSIRHLKDWKGGIFCTTSHALSLIRYGIQPTHLVALDPFCTYDEIAGIDWSKTRTKLITHPGVWPSLVQKWPNELILYMQNVGDPNSFYATYQKQMYMTREYSEDKSLRDPVFKYMISTDYAMFACSPPLQLFVADTLGYGNIFLAGVDFAYTYGKERFTDWTVKESVKESNPLGIDPDKNNYDEQLWDAMWEEHDHPLTPVPKERGPIMSNNGIPSERIHLYYKKNFMSAWRLCQKTIYTTDHGAITEIPFADITKVIKKRGLNFPQLKEWFIKKTTDKYLASIGCYVVESKEGKSFVESEKPLEEIYAFVINLFQQYKCDTCRNAIGIKDVPPFYDPMKKTLDYMITASKDDPTKYAEAIVPLSKSIKEVESNNTIIDHEGQLCPVCGKGKLLHTAHIDINDNMNRIKLLLEKPHEGE